MSRKDEAVACCLKAGGLWFQDLLFLFIASWLRSGVGRQWFPLLRHPGIRFPSFNDGFTTCRRINSLPLHRATEIQFESALSRIPLSEAAGHTIRASRRCLRGAARLTAQLVCHDVFLLPLVLPCAGFP